MTKAPTTWETRPPERLAYPSKHPSELEAVMDRQRARFNEAGATRLLEGDEFTPAGPLRGLQEGVKYCKANRSTLMLCEAERGARSALEFFNLLDDCSKSGVPVEILDFGGKKVRSDEPCNLTLLEIATAFKNFERSNQLLRQRDGIARAKNKKLYKGRHPSARLQKEEIWKRFIELRQPASKIAEELGISVPSVYRIARDMDAERAGSKSDFLALGESPNSKN